MGYSKSSIMAKELESLVGKKVVLHIQDCEDFMVEDYLVFENGRVIINRSGSAFEDGPGYFYTSIEIMKKILANNVRGISYSRPTKFFGDF